MTDSPPHRAQSGPPHQTPPSCPIPGGPRKREDKARPARGESDQRGQFPSPVMGIHPRSPQLVLLYGTGRQSRGKGGPPSSQKCGRATAAGACRGRRWLLGPRCSPPSSRGEQQDSSSPATQHRADRSQGTQGSRPSHPHVGDT